MFIDKTPNTTPFFIYSLSHYSELIQEYQEDEHRTNELDQEEIDMEYQSLQGSPVSKLILDHLLRNIPAQEQTGEKTCCRQEQLTRYEVEPVEQGLATERQLICSPQRKRTECTNDGTRYRNNHGTLLSVNLQLLIEERSIHLVKLHQGCQCFHSKKYIEHQGDNPAQYRHCCKRLVKDIRQGDEDKRRTTIR